jgi:hypothetical protein
MELHSRACSQDSVSPNKVAFVGILQPYKRRNFGLLEGMNLILFRKRGNRINYTSAHWADTASEEVLQNTSTPVGTRGYRDIFPNLKYPSQIGLPKLPLVLMVA